MIDDADITFVVQGSQHIVKGQNKTILVINSIRKWYPKSTIIFSTSDPIVDSRIDSDMTIQIKDVGPLLLKGAKPINTNRQLASTKAGMEKVTSKWVCKTRSDVIFTHKADFSDFQERFKYSKKGIPRLVSGDKIVVSGINTKRFNIKKEYINHVSDWFYFGKSDDIELLFCLPLYDPKGLDRNQILSAEKYIWESFSKKHRDFEDSLSWAESFLVGNAILINPSALGLKSLKKGYSFPFGVNGYHGMQHGDWFDLYRAYNNIPQSPINIKLAVRVIKRRFFQLRHRLCYIPILRIRRYLINNV